jgi:N6-L-threonylcarbamoyladenine synthase
LTRILGIETSCDETAAAVVEDRTRVRSNVVASSAEVHRKYGGVVPELASRHQVESIGPVVELALEKAGVGLDAVDAVAVTWGPGLVGSLLVGVSAAKAIAWQRRLPLLAVNHLEGHIRSCFLEHEIEFPALALVVSGGHTHLYLCPEEGVYRTLARTRDDAAGEAFDKVAKLLGLGYPGGPVVDRLSAEGNENALTFPKAVMKDGSHDFSFSGLKSAVRRHVQARQLQRPAQEPQDSPATQEVKDLVASFQRAVVEALVDNTVRMAAREEIRTVLVAGGVANNRRLRRGFEEAGRAHDLRVVFPSPPYTTDNAAMIAAAGFLHLASGRTAGLDLNADPNLKLGTVTFNY